MVWRSAGKGAFILGRRYRGDGTAIDTDPFIVALTEGPTDRVRVEWSPAVNQFLVVWDEDFGVFGVRVLPAGAAPDEVVLDDESPMELSEGVRDMRTADVGSDGDDWLVVFDGSEARPEARGTFDNFIWATLVGAATGEPGSPTPISSPDTANVFPAVAGNTVQGGFGVVWQSAGTIGRGIAIIGGEVVGRLVTSAGAPTGDEVIVSLPDDDMETTGPEIAFNKDANEYLVAWTQIAFLTLRQQLPTAQVYGRRLSSVLGGLTDVLQISIAGEPPRDGGTPAAAYDTSSCTYVTPYVRGTAFGSVRGNAGGFVPPNVFARGFDAPDCPTPGSPPAAVAQQAQQLGTALPRTCASRRNFTIRLVRRKGRVYRSARIRVNGKLVKVVFGRRVTAPVDLRGLPRGTFTVSIEVRLANGRRMKGARRYRTCEKKLPPSNGLDRPDAL